MYWIEYIVTVEFEVFAHMPFTATPFQHTNSDGAAKEECEKGANQEETNSIQDL